MSRVKHAAAMAHLRLVCTLGLRPELLVPAIVEALQIMIGFSNIGFQWVARDGRLENIWFGQQLNPVVVREYADRFIHTPNVACRRGFAFMIRQNGVRMLPDWGAGFYASDYYDAIWRPLRFHWGLVGTVRAPCDVIGRSVVSVYRGAADKAFKQADADVLTQALPYLAHAFGSGDAPPAPYVDTADEGLLVVTRRGAIEFATDSAVDLLFYGSGANLNRCATSATAMTLVRRIVAILEGSPAHVAPPSLYIDNAFGRYTFRAHWFGRDQDRIGISVRRQEPLLLRLARASRLLALSPTQKQILLFAAQHCSNTDIARRLHVQPDTVKGHMTAILERLGVHDRNQIAEAVLRAPGEGGVGAARDLAVSA